MLISNLPYLNDDHRNRFLQLIFQDKTHNCDNERLAMFYILSGNKDIRSKPLDAYYNFERHTIKRFGTRKHYLPSSGATLLRLGFNLYNSQNKSDCIFKTFSNLDDNNFDIALTAIKIRFNNF